MTEPALPDAGKEPAVIVWVTSGTWQATVDAARSLAPAGAHISLLHVSPDEVPEAGHSAYAGLLGRGRPGRDPGTTIEHLAATSAADLLEAAAQRLAAPCARLSRQGRVEREVVITAEGADLLIVGRDGDLARLGPKSLGKQARFVVDHAPCPVLLVWPRPAPPTAAIPPPPPGPGPHGPDPHGPAPHERGPHGSGPRWLAGHGPRHR